MFTCNSENFLTNFNEIFTLDRLIDVVKKDNVDKIEDFFEQKLIDIRSLNPTKRILDLRKDLHEKIGGDISLQTDDDIANAWQI